MEDDGDLSSSDWLVYEVLLRLPLKCVFTCRLVSKLWLSISSDPSFIRAYASRASSRPRWIILSSDVNFEITGRSNWKYVMPPELYLPGDQGRPELVLYADSRRAESLSYRIVGVSNGLVLYYPAEHELFSFYICNPITGRWIRACDFKRAPSPNYSMPGWGFITRIDEEEEFVLKRYRIILARGIGNALIFNVYYSEMDECKKFKVPLLRSHRHGPIQLQAYAAVLNELLHWAEMGLGVIIYDPDSNPNRIRVVPHPRQVEWPRKMLSCLCLEYRGELRYIAGYSGESPGFDIWSLRDDGRWCFQHKIVIEGIIVRDMGSVFFDPCDPDSVSCLINGRFIFSYNSKCGTFEKQSEMTVEKGGLPFRWRALSCTHPLVVPPWPIRVDEEHLEPRPRVSCQANPQSGKRKAQSGKRKAAASRILKSHPMSKSLADSGTTFEDGVRRSKRIRMRPLEYWKGERFLYGRVNDEVKLIGVKYISPGEDNSDLKLKPYVSSDNGIVKGVIDPEKLVSDVHKKTGKQASVVVKEEEKKVDDEKKNEEKKDDKGDGKLPKGESTKKEEEDDEDDGGKESDIKKREYWPPKYYMEYYYAPQIFSDENPNACAVM